LLHILEFSISKGSIEVVYHSNSLIPSIQHIIVKSQNRFLLSKKYFWFRMNIESEMLVTSHFEKLINESINRDSEWEIVTLLNSIPVLVNHSNRYSFDATFDIAVP
jgi:hypothetical protein